MERRSEARVTANQAVALTVLGETPAESRTVRATMTNLSGRGMKLYAGERLPLDAAVKVDLTLDGQEAMILGEVRHCAPDGQRFLIGLHLQHSLLDLTSLGRLVHRLLAEDRRAQREVTTA